MFSCILFALVLIPAKCNVRSAITVCVEDDNDLRVDCLGDPKPNQINTYEFSWSSGAKESVLNTNVSGKSVESQYKGKSTVVELEPNGYRMTLSGFTDQLPPNTTYLCKLSGAVASVTVEKGRQMTVWMVLGREHESEWERNSTGFCHFSPHFSSSADKLAKCSAVSVFLKSSVSWIVCLLFFYQIHS